MANIDKIKYSDYGLTKGMLETEKEFYLTKPEVDKIFYFEKFKKTEEFAVNK